MFCVAGTGNFVFACFWLRVLLLLSNGGSEGFSELMGDLKIYIPWRNSEKVKCKFTFY